MSCASDQKLTERYAKVAIFGNATQLKELNKLELPLDHITLYPDSAVVGYFSYYDLKKIRRSSYRFKILQKDVQKNNH